MNDDQKAKRKNMLENLKQQTLEAEAAAKEDRERAELFLWTEQDMILPIFDAFMAGSKSIYRFVKMFDSDPAYYLEQARKKCSFFDSLVFLMESGDPDLWVQPIKAFACHYSERQSDITQLEKFYRKNMALVLNHFPNQIPEGTPVDFHDEIAYYLMFLCPKLDDSNQPSANEICQLGISILAIYLHRKHPVKITVCRPTSALIYDHMLLAYYFRTGTTPPEMVKSQSIERLTERMANHFISNNSFPVQMSNAWKTSAFGTSRYFEVLAESFKKRCKSQKSGMNNTDADIVISDFESINRLNETVRHTMLYYIHQYLDNQAQKSITKTAGKPNEADHSEEPHKGKNKTEILLRADLLEKMDQLERANAKSSRLQELLNKEKETSKELRDEVSQLKEDYNSLKKELDESRDLLSHLSDDEDEDFDMENTELTDDEKELIEAARIVIVGGHCHLQKFLRDMFSNVRFLDAEPSAVDPQVIRSADLVCYLPHHLSHSMFERVKSIATTAGVKQVYHRTNNVTFIYKTIAKGLAEL